MGLKLRTSKILRVVFFFFFSFTNFSPRNVEQHHFYWRLAGHDSSETSNDSLETSITNDNDQQDHSNSSSPKSVESSPMCFLLGNRTYIPEPQGGHPVVILECSRNAGSTDHQFSSFFGIISTEISWDSKHFRGTGWWHLTLDRANLQYTPQRCHGLPPACESSWEAPQWRWSKMIESECWNRKAEQFLWNQWY